ncbi:MAG: CRISPR-associated helicase Cas3' [Armatimonadetes bacterium]|nr:CRISPR-associated helicase Cas3' [Armatimonadota bacterium]
MLHTQLWAKSDPYHPLWCHLLDVAAVCEALLPRFGGVEGLPTPWLLYLVALHDIGKADAEFQNKDPQQAQRLAALGLTLPAEVTKFRHEARSADWLSAKLKTLGWGKQPAQAIAGAIRGHHGDFGAQAYREQDPTLAARVALWAPLREALAALVRDTLGAEAFALTRCRDASAAGMKLSGLIVLADWIASNHEQYPYHDNTRLDDSLSPRQYWRAAQREAKIAVARLELTAPPAAGPEPPAFNDIWPGFTVRAVQRAVEEAALSGVGPGLAIIEAPMGEGKTEAAVYLAEYWNRRTGRAGLYFALPTQATSNQMHKRYWDYLQRTSPTEAPRLVHGMSWLLDEIPPAETARTYGDQAGGEDNEPLSREWFRNAKRALLAPHGVGTVDQALMAALNVKHGFLRFLGLNAKTLIVDEVHAYDAYMTTLLCRLLVWCRALEIPVILLSATLSWGQKQQLCRAYAGRDVLPTPSAQDEPYPLLTFVPLDAGPDAPAQTISVTPDPSRDRTVALEVHPGALEDPLLTAALAAAQVQDGGCVCVVVNTVVAAQETFRALKDRQRQNGLPPDTRLMLFHARFRAETREEIEKEVLRRFGKDAGANRPRRAILVATSVVEQSLDIDFDVMLSQLAPVDLLLQRSGRVWRHAHHPRHGRPGPALHLLLPTAGRFHFGGTGLVYQPELLLRTLDLLWGRPAFQLPADIRPLIEACYGATEPPATVPPEVFAKAVRKRIADQQKAEDEAKKHLIPDPDPAVFQLAQTKEIVAEAEEGQKADFFHAQTRLGDQTVSSLVLHDPELLALVRRGIAHPKAPPPPQEKLRALFWQKANLPARWLAEATAAPGFEIITDGPRWLRHHVVLGFRDGVWQGEHTPSNDQRAPITIEDHPAEGLRRRELPAASGEQPDADA